MKNIILLILPLLTLTGCGGVVPSDPLGECMMVCEQVFDARDEKGEEKCVHKCFDVYTINCRPEKAGEYVNVDTSHWPEIN